jgi:hypothetical protein
LFELWGIYEKSLELFDECLREASLDDDVLTDCLLKYGKLEKEMAVRKMLALVRWIVGCAQMWHNVVFDRICKQWSRTYDLHK